MRMLRLLALLEGLSLLVLLFIAMPLKYALNRPTAVQQVGMAHGLLFIAYCLWLMAIAYQGRWKAKPILVSIIAAFVPFGTFYCDRKYFRNAAR
ncbi:MAG: DUF3817 domain-containing protein [Owenweeksia sp.]|nr:DUF3817 domain-containing protein [Owenweeksia sp.]